MKNKLFLTGIVFLSLLVSACSFGCGSSSSNDSKQSSTSASTSTRSSSSSSKSTSTSQIPTNTYTVTWKNHDESILEIDENVPEGTVPQYNGPTPTFQYDDSSVLIFSGWTPKPSPIYSDTTYYACYAAAPLDNILFDYEQVEGGYRLNISADTSATLSYDHSFNIEHASELVEVYVGRNIETIQYLYLESPVLKKLTIGPDVKKIVYLFFSDVVLDGIYFEGDEPEIRYLRHTNTVGNMPYMPYIYYDPTKNGWDEFAVSGCILKTHDEPEKTLPEMTLRQWARAMVDAANNRVETIFREMAENGEEDLFMLPSENNLEGNPIIKAFTEELVEGCTTTLDKINAIFDWVSENITYDTDYSDVDSYTAFTIKRGVCAQYTNLMRDMLSFVNIPSCAIQCVPFLSTNVTSYEQLLCDPHSEEFPGASHILLAVYQDGHVLYYDPTWQDVYMNNYARVAGNYYLYAVNYVDICSEVVDYSFLDYGTYTPCIAWANGKLYGFINKHIGCANAMEFMTNFAFNQVFMTEQEVERNGYKYCEIIRSGFTNPEYLSGAMYSRADGLSYNVMRLLQFYKEDNPRCIPLLLEKHNVNGVKVVDDYFIVRDELQLYLGKDKDLVIPHIIEGNVIKSIGFYAIPDNNYVETITFEEGIEEIYMQAVCNCENLKTVTFPDSLKCSYDPELAGELKDELYGVQVTPVHMCINFERYIVGQNNLGYKSVNGALYSKDGKYLFSVPPKCSNAPLDGVDCIFNEAFACNSVIEEVVIPKSVTYIGVSAFHYCTGLRSVIYQCDDVFECEATFKDCPNLSHVELPSKRKTIIRLSFYMCLSLYEIVLPDSVETIEEAAFYYSGLVHINLPKNLYFIDMDAFEGCQKLYDIDNYSSLPITKGSNNYGAVAKRAKDITEAVYVYNVDDFIFFDNGTLNALMSYVGKITDNSLTLPASFHDKTYSIHSKFFNEGSGYNIMVGTATNSIIHIPLYTFLHDAKTVYIPEGITYSTMTFPKTVTIVRT